MITDGTASTADFRSSTQRVPMSARLAGGGVARQSVRRSDARRCAIETDSGMSAGMATRALNGKGRLIWTSSSRAASASVDEV